MRPDSVTKAWTAALILRLVDERRMKLEDTSSAGCPGGWGPGGGSPCECCSITRAGWSTPTDLSAHPERAIAHVRDAVFRARMVRLLRAVRADPRSPVPAAVIVRLAADQPLLWAPGTPYRYSNVGYEIAGLIATRVTGEARFLQGLVGGRLLAPGAGPRDADTERAECRQLRPRVPITATGPRHRRVRHNGAGFATKASVMVSGDGARATAVLLNGDSATRAGVLDGRADAAATAAALRLFCAA